MSPEIEISRAKVKSPDAEVSRAHMSPEIEVSRAHMFPDIEVSRAQESPFVGVPVCSTRSGHGSGAKHCSSHCE